MSFQSELLDCYDLLKKRTSATTEAEHALGSFIKNFVTIHKEWLAKFTDFTNKSKKEYLSKMDGTVANAFSSILDEMLQAYQTQMGFTEEVLKQKNEIDSDLKEREKKQKELIKAGESLQKGWETQLDLLKKARTNYVKAGKEVFC